MPNYPYYYQPYQPYQPPMADQLTQLRQSYQPMQQPQQAPASPSIVWVQSEMEAANYLVAPNSAVTLWDSNASGLSQTGGRKRQAQHEDI